MSRSKQRFFKKDLEEVDAILPFMSLLIIIIPLLLSNLAFYHFKVIQASYPGASDPNQAEAPAPTKKEKMVMAQLLIEPNVIQLEVLDEDDGSSIKKVRKEANTSNGKDLFNILKDFRTEYPKLDTILVTTHVDVIYDSLVNILHEFKQVIPKVGELDEVKAEEEGFKFKIVVLPASQELTIPAGS